MSRSSEDRIYIEDLMLRCVIGITEEERRDKQDVVINIKLYVDLENAIKTDAIDQSVNYRDICKRIINLVENEQPFSLLESLAGRIADIVLSEFAVNGVKVRVDKPYALRFAKSVAVELVRWNRG